MRELPKICNRIKQDLYNLYKYVQDSVPKLNNDLLEQKMLGWTVPEECPIKNEVSGKQFIQKVGRIDLGSLNWNLNNRQASPYMFYADSNIEYKHAGNDREVPTWICSSKGHNVESSYDISHSNQSSNYALSLEPDSNYKRLYVADTNFNDKSSSEVNAMLSGTYLYYELATPITMTIDGNEAIEKVNASLGGLSFEKDTNDNLIVTVSTGSKYEIAMTPQPQTQSLEDE